MGTSLTGLTPATTYDALIKVTDNGPLSATAKYLSDGLGNDSVLALSTGNIGIGTTAPDSKLDITGGNITINTASTTFADFKYGTVGSETSRGTITTDGLDLTISSTVDLILNPAGNVGIGTSTPSQILSVEKNVLNPSLISLTGSFGTSRGAVISLAADDLGANESALKFTTQTAAPYGGYVFSNQSGELLRVMSSGGITFNGDTAAANALDDYEEGTWSPQVYYQNSTDQANSTNVTQVGTYTKIGRQVTVSGTLQWTITGSPAVDNIGIKNLPFTSINSSDYFSFGQMQLISADSYPALTLDLFINANSTLLLFVTPTGISNQGANVGTTGTKTARFSITYFV